jgi:two-component system LytT family sensor kinase
VRAYVEIEAQRFRDRLDVRWDVDDAPLDARVPDLLVQPLVENALRHGLWPRPGRGTLTVRATVRGARAPARGTRLVIEVEDDGAGLPPGWADGARDGTGLGATRARLLALYGADASLASAPRPGAARARRSRCSRSPDSRPTHAAHGHRRVRRRRRRRRSRPRRR